MDEVFNDDQIEKHLSNLSVDWGVIGGAELVRVLKFDDFKSALEFVIKVGAIAEKENHHPDVSLSWGKVELRVSNHAAGGITQKDFVLAQKIDSL